MKMLAGIGAELLSVQEGWQVTDIMEQSPAQNAGLAKGDLIIKINGESVGKVDWVPEEGVTTLFTVQREGMTRDIVVIPQKIEPLPAIIAKPLPNGYGYIRIRSFVQEGIEDEFEKAMEQFSQAKGVIIDVRHNPGGRMDAVLTMLNGCLPDKTEVLCLLEAEGKGRAVSNKRGAALYNANGCAYRWAERFCGRDLCGGFTKPG